MNFFPMNAGGGKLEETTLWTNSSPNSNFSAQEITLSESIENFDYVKIEYAFDTSYQTGNQKNGCIIDIVDVKKWLYTSGTRHVIGSLASSDGNNYEYTRDVFYISNTSLLFGTTYLVTTSSSANQMNIPISVIGVKQTQGGGTIDPPALVGTTLWTNSSPTSTFASQYVTLSESIADYDYIKIKYAYDTSYQTGDCVSSILVSKEDLDKWHESNSTKHNIGAVAIQNSNNVDTYGRTIFKSTDTKLFIGNCYLTGGSTMVNGAIIPLEIIGLKKTSDVNYKVVYGTFTVDVATGDVVVETGLSNIKTFVALGKANNGNAYHSYLSYDADDELYRFEETDYNGIQTNNYYTPLINSVSGGNVTIKAETGYNVRNVLYKYTAIGS